MTVPPGSGGVFEMAFPVPGEAKLIDHALSRVVRKGMLRVIQVEGAENPAIFQPTLPGDPFCVEPARRRNFRRGNTLTRVSSVSGSHDAEPARLTS